MDHETRFELATLRIRPCWSMAKCSYTDRDKSVTKRFLLTDEGGVRQAVAVSIANTHDMQLVEPTLKSFSVRRLRPKPDGRKQHSCGDKGYDYAASRNRVRR